MASSLLALLRMLAERGVEHVVIGGMAGVLQGAPVVTADLDIVHRRTDENIGRLLPLLTEMQAVFRGDPRRLEPTEEHLMGRGHLLLVTRFGPLDILCEVLGRGFEDLEPDTETLSLGDGLTVRVLTLKTLIALKEAAGRPKDVMALPVLRATLAERQRRP